MQWLITGGTGLIGRVLAQQLTRRGDRVHILSRDPSKASLFSHPNIYFFTGDILESGTLSPAMAGCDGVFHLAGYAKVWAKDKRIFHDINVTGTINVLNAARQCAIRRVVITSTAGVLGPAKGHPKTETERDHDPYETYYEKSKSAGEKAALAMANQELEVVITYPTRVFGPGPLHDSNAITRFIKWCAEGKWHFLPGKGNNLGNYVYVEDIAQGLILAMERGRNKEGYLFGGENLTFRQMFQIIGQYTGKKKKHFLPLPWFVMFIIVTFFMLNPLITGRPPLINFRWLKHYMQDWQFSSEKAQRELGYHFHSFEEGVAETWKFLQNNNDS